MLRDREPDPAGTYVLYWMQQSQRCEHNPALEYAIRLANELDQSVLVGFGLYEGYPEAGERHFAFLLEGLAEVADGLSERGIKLVVRRGRPDRVAIELARKASVVVCDRGYLREPRQWRRRLVRAVDRRVVQIEGDVVVPVEVASDKAEFAARTIRPKLERQRDDYLSALTASSPGKSSLPLQVHGDWDVRKTEDVLASLRIDRTVGRIGWLRGGLSEVRRRLTAFLRGDFQGYADGRGDPTLDQTSKLSPYLHYGQISPVEVAGKVQAAKGGAGDDGAAFLEELVVRRELAANYVLYTKHYDTYRGLPAWARKTLSRHADDPRPHHYTRRQLEHAHTHDRVWNAAMREMRDRGYLHNHLRMYWGKKILEWTNTPEYAHRTALYLNNKYLLDGRDPSSYANVGWLFGLHDRPWGEREIYGTVRSMTAAGLERKFDVDRYLNTVEARLGGR